MGWDIAVMLVAVALLVGAYVAVDRHITWRLIDRDDTGPYLYQRWRNGLGKLRILRSRRDLLMWYNADTGLWDADLNSVATAIERREAWKRGEELS